MAINLVQDVGAPATSAVINIVTRTTMPEWHDMVIYGVTALGYLSDYFMRNDFIKQVGVCTAPLAIDKLYERVRGAPVSAGARRVYKPVNRLPAPPYAGEFAGANLD